MAPPHAGGSAMLPTGAPVPGEGGGSVSVVVGENHTSALFASEVPAIVELSTQLLPLLIPSLLFALLLLPLVWGVRRWYATQTRAVPWIEACVGSPTSATPPRAEGTPLLQAKCTPTAGGDAPKLWLDVRDMCVCVVGVLMSHVFYGYYQEMLMTERWGSADGSEGEQFLHASFTVMLNRLASLVLATLCVLVACVASGGWSALAAPAAPLWEYSVGAFANTVSSVSQYASLHFISFPTLVLSKACKMPPVMLLGYFLIALSLEAQPFHALALPDLPLGAAPTGTAALCFARGQSDALGGVSP